MNTEELIVMGVLMILAGGLMVARHFINNIPTDRPHSLPMATHKVDIGNTEEDLPINAAIAEALDVGDKQIATLKQRIFAQDRRIAELEQRHERMVQNYEDLIATFKEREAAMDKVLLIEHNRLRDLEHRV